MTPLQAIIFGVVEGITEYLPISSTGHLIIVRSLMGIGEGKADRAAIDDFLIVIQGGAILAVLGLYFPRVVQMLRGLIGRDRMGRRLFINILIAFLPAAVSGPLLAEIIEEHLFRPIPVVAALALGGIVMIVLTPWQRRHFHGSGQEDPEDAHSYVDIEHLTWRRALVIGLLQCVAMWPGTSRSMMTIVGGMVVGLRPKQAAEFSFLLGLPTLGGACVYKLAGSLLGGEKSMFEVLDPWSLLLGLTVATICAALAVKWLVGYLSRHGVALFGWYRLGLCAVLLVLMAMGMVELS